MYPFILLQIGVNTQLSKILRWQNNQQREQFRQQEGSSRPKDISCYNMMQKVKKKQTLKAHFGEESQPSIPKKVKKNALVKEFQEFKQQIQQFEDKNEAALNRIRENYNFKKRQITANQNKTQQIIDTSIYSAYNPQLNFSVDQPNMSSKRYLPPSVKMSMQYQPQIYCPEERVLDKIGESQSVVDSPNKNDQAIDQITPQCQKYGFKTNKRSSSNSSQHNRSLQRINYVVSSGIQNIPTEQSDYILETQKRRNLSNQQELTRYIIENQNLMLTLDSLQQKYLSSEQQNNELKAYINNRQNKYDQTVNEKANLHFKRTVKKIMEDFFYASEEYFERKMTDIQRHIRKIENKVKRLEFSVVGWQEEKQEAMQKRIKMERKNQKDNKMRKGSVGVITNSSEINVIKTIQDPQNKENQQTLKKQIQFLQSNLQSLKKELQLQKATNIDITVSLRKQEQFQSILKNEIEAKIRIIDELTENSSQKINNQLLKIKQLEDKINELEHNRNLEQSKSQKLEQSCKILEKQSKKKQLKLKDEYEQLQSDLKTIQEEYTQKLAQMDHLQNEISENRKKLLDKDMEILALNSKIRTLQNDVLSKDKKIEGLQEIINKFQMEQSSTEMSPKQSSLLNKNSIVQIHFQESRDSFEDWSQEHIAAPQQSKQLDSNLSIIRVVDPKKDQLKRQSEESIQIPKAHQDIQDAFNNALHAEIDKLRKEVDILTRENHYYLDQLEELSKMFSKAEEEKSFQQKKAEEASFRMVSLEKKLKLSQLLLTQKSQLISHHDIKLSQLQSLDYSESYLHDQVKSPENGNDLKIRLTELENEVELINYSQKMEREQNKQLLNKLKLQIQHKDQQLKLYYDEIQRLNYQLNMNQPNERKDSLALFQEGNQLSLKHCKLSYIEAKEEGGYRESLSFRLSADPSECFFPKVSKPQNITDVFKEDQFLQQKMKKGKTFRNDQIKMFQKTTHYIKSLKDNLAEKARQIKELQKQIKLLKSKDQNILGSLEDKAMARLSQSFENPNYESFNDSSSQQRSKSRQGCKSVKIPSLKKVQSVSRQIQAQKDFLMQENKILLREIQILNGELQRSQEQMTSLTKLKDFYKEELNKQTELYIQKLKAKDSKIYDLENASTNLPFLQTEKERSLIKDIICKLQELKERKRSEKDQEEVPDKIIQNLRQLLMISDDQKSRKDL